MSDCRRRDDRPTPPPKLADHLRAAVIDWLEADGRDAIHPAEIEAAFKAAFDEALRDALEAGWPAPGPAT